MVLLFCSARAEDSAMINQRLAPLKWNLRISGTVDKWSVGAERLAVIKRPGSLRWSLGNAFLSQHREAVLRRRPRLCLVLAAELGSGRVTQVVLVLRAWRGSREQRRLGTVWQCWSPWGESRRGHWSKRSPIAERGPTFWSCWYHGQPARTAVVEWSLPELTTQAVCAAEGRAGEVTSAQETASGSQTLDAALLITLL